MKREFIAHSENTAGKVHKLSDHLIHTAKLVGFFAPSEELYSLFYLAGLFHDIGKFQDGFQKYLLEGGKKTLHSGIGAFLTSTKGNNFLPLQFAIQGHHAGLPNNEDRKQNNDEYKEEKQLVVLMRQRFEEIYPNCLDTKAEYNLPNDLLLVECLTRILFSSLTDADWLDTEKHFAQKKFEARKAQELHYGKLLLALENNFAALPTKGTINELRTKSRNEAIKHSKESTGFFSLQLPTGLGKTLTSMYWALKYAEHNKLKRIIIVLPYINIIDQTASIFKDIFGEIMVLEHHSSVIEDDNEYADESFVKGQATSRRLACENWDAPIIVTTSVQFFESLFSNKPFKCRKNHNIANSVVIFDEIQTLPKQYAEPIIVLLKYFSDLAHTSFLFCTATQPAFAKREGFDGLEKINPLIKKPAKYFTATRRVDYSFINRLKPVPLDEVKEILSKEKDSYLAIVNTKTIAKQLFESQILINKHEKYYHLSTAMCPHHRKEAIKRIISDLKDKKRITVISTQLVEAGIDFDFPCVYRAIAPLDAIIQAAGRCNRNGTLRKKGRVILFNLENQRWPDRAYGACAAYTQGIIQDDKELLHHYKSFERYYEVITTTFEDTDRYDITEERKRFNFKTVANSFKIIREQTTTLFIKEYSDESRNLFTEIEKTFLISRQQLRNLQQFSVQVYPNFLEKYKGQIEYYRDTFRIWHGVYDKETGLSPKDVETVF